MLSGQHPAGGRSAREINLNIYMKMEQLNRIEIIGRVGNATVNKYGEAQTIRFSVATDYVYKDKTGTPVIETTWHNVSAWENKNFPDLFEITRGKTVRVVGRVRQYKITTPEGAERTFSDIYAGTIEILDQAVTAQCSF